MISGEITWVFGANNFEKERLTFPRITTGEKKKEEKRICHRDSGYRGKDRELKFNFPLMTGVAQPAISLLRSDDD